MTRHMTALRNTRDQLRLLLAETMFDWCLTVVWWAVGLAPKGHPDSRAITKAALIITAAIAGLALRRPTNTVSKPARCSNASPQG